MPKSCPQSGVIQINAQSSGKRAALLIELERLRQQMKVIQLRIEHIEIMLRDEDYDFNDLSRENKDTNRG